MEDYSGVMVYGEIAGGKLASTTSELLECGRKLAAELGQDLSCVLAGDVPPLAVEDAGARGATTVYTADMGGRSPLDVESQLPVAMAAVAAAKPALILIGHAALGRELGPRLAFRLGTAVTTDCIDLKIDPDTRLVVMTKPVYGGNALVDLVDNVMPQMATVRPKAMSAGEPEPGRKARIVPLSVEFPPGRVQVKERVLEEIVGVKLEDAAVVVSGGRGVAGPDPFNTVLKDLADVLHGAVGASRPACDNTWAPETMHIGLTGKIVAPEIYIAIAISGASQHMSGCSGSKTIIAINKDPEANIFREANFGVVGRFEDVVPAFTTKLRELLSD